MTLDQFRLFLAVAVPCLIAAGVGYVLQHKGFPPVRWLSALISLWITLFLFMAMGLRGVPLLIRRWVREKPGVLLLLPLPLFLAWLVYHLGTMTGSYWWTAAVALYLWLPLIVVRLFPGREDVPGWQDVCIVLALWMPVEWRLLHGAWYWPEGQGVAAFLVPTACIIMVLALETGRGLKDTGFRFLVRREDWRPMVNNLNLATLVVVPGGLLTGFLQWNPTGDALQVMGTFVGILLLVALPEELLFRGIMQNLLQKALGRPWPALLLTSVIFGLSHFNNAAFPGGPVPDWRFMVFATFSGIFYGRVYRQTGGIFPGALIHTVMNTTWFHLLRGG